MLETAKRICRQIEAENYQALIVGGTVRDLLMELAPHDVDIATNMPISQISKKFKTYDIGKSRDFGIVVVNQDGYSFEIAQFRNDGNYSDGRRPDSITKTSSFQEDSSRRDFTINAMGMTADGKIIDHHDGLQDIESKILRTVGNPRARFLEDKLRVMRLVRFATKLGFVIDKQTKITAKSMSKEIHSLAVERIQEELLKAAELGGKKFSKYIQLLDKLRLLQEILPEVAALKFKPETHEHHPENSNTFGHTLKALEFADDAKPMELIAILLHDVGKTTTQGLKSTSHHTYHRHDAVGAVLVEALAKRLNFSNKEVELLVFTTKNHMRFHKILEMKPSKIMKLVGHDNFQELSVVCAADSFGRRTYKEVVAHALTIKERVGNQKVTALVTGTMIMDLLGIEQGKEVGRIKNLVSEMVVDNNITDQKTINKLIREV